MLASNQETHVDVLDSVHLNGCPFDLVCAANQHGFLTFSRIVPVVSVYRAEVSRESHIIRDTAMVPLPGIGTRPSQRPEDDGARSRFVGCHSMELDF